MLKYDNKQNQQNTYSLEARSSSARRAIRFESHSPTCMFGTTCNICRLTQTCTIVKQENKTKNYPSLSYSHGSVLANFFRLPLIAKHSYKEKRDFIFDSMPRGCQATTIHRMHRRTWRKWKRRCLATATHQRSLL